VWVKKTPGSEKLICSVCENRSQALELCRRLYTIKKKIDYIENPSTGYFIMDVGRLYTLERPISFQVMPLMTSGQ
jgi:hypothetical protein